MNTGLAIMGGLIGVSIYGHYTGTVFTAGDLFVIGIMNGACGVVMMVFGSGNK